MIRWPTAMDEIRGTLDSAGGRALYSHSTCNQLARSAGLDCFGAAERSGQLSAERRLRLCAANPARCASAGLPWRKLCSAGPTSSYSDSAEMLSGNSDLNEEAAPASGAGGVRTQPRATRCAHAAQLISTIRCWLAGRVMTPRKSCSTICERRTWRARRRRRGRRRSCNT